MHAHVSWHHYMAREYATALTQAEQVVRMEPAFHWGHFFAGWALERLGRGSEAVEALRQAARVSSNSPVMLASLGHVLAVLGDRREARRVALDLERLRGEKGIFAYELGVIALALGEHERALTWFERALVERSGWMAYMRVDPRLDSVRDDARFADLGRRADGRRGS
jgi:tetratricopeptide (TPR) repeat protein